MCVANSLFLYGNYSTSYGAMSVITGTPVNCINGLWYGALCNDNTTDPSSANAICATLRYYGQLADIKYSPSVVTASSLFIVKQVVGCTRTPTMAVFLRELCFTIISFVDPTQIPSTSALLCQPHSAKVVPLC